MIMHHMPLARRAVAYVFPAIIVVIAALAAPAFAETGRIWWLVAILALPAALAVLICVEYRAAALGFDADGVHFRSVGYRMHVPWQDISLETQHGKPIIRARAAVPQFFPWLGFLYSVLAVLVPRRARHAGGMMSIIPLYAFIDDGGRVLADLRASAPAGSMTTI